ncbi:alanine dehydrogenase [Desulforhopalus sp. IMCC35007]|uniref:alanine dehydrogenase n=1 Tax=Desulforhopalus sp. IMCC35007 TaxID=2569543 RepID=UPI0010AE66A2|nr:alanine dehydrogenase [Desulforhopalus sp. IMCC35007]TKB07790.1 alanine dehydrogenase [Desulforhopalus sp. IMCC35007]
MKVGILKEIKVLENRVCMVPSGVVTMIANGHEVIVENNAGAGAGFPNDDYIAAGATIVETPAEVYGSCDMVMHVKEPQPSEYDLIREGQIVFTYLHLAADEQQTKALMKAKSINIAYETIEKSDGSLPLLVPMSEVAGRMAAQEGAKYLEMPQGGRGILLGGVKGVAPATVVVIGGGVVGLNAAKMAAGLGAQVYILDTNLERLAYLDDVMPANVFPIMSNPAILREYVTRADLVIGAVLIPGAKAPKLITRDMLKDMKNGSVIVDVAIDQGGCIETSKATTHAEPTYVVDGVVHYCVANMPGAVARTSTIALTNATLSYAVEIANKGWKKAMQENEEIKLGANVIDGQITYKAVSEAFNLGYTPVDNFL